MGAQFKGPCKKKILYSGTQWYRGMVPDAYSPLETYSMGWSMPGLLTILIPGQSTPSPNPTLRLALTLTLP